MKDKKLVIAILLFIQFYITIQHEELYVDILGTNDTHGAGIELNKQVDNQQYQVGGYKLLSGLVNILRKDNPKGTLWLDAGDQFQGTLENYKTEGDLMTDFFNTMGLDAATIGNHEWDWGKDRIIKFMNNATYKYILSNMKRKSKDEIEKIKQTIKDDKQKADLDKALEDKVINFQDKVQQTRVFSLHDGKIKIGVIGLTTIETFYSTALPPLDYEISDKYADKIIELSSQLRSQQGVNAVIVLSHVGMLCPIKDLDQFRTFKVRKATDQEDIILKCKDKEIPPVLDKLPPGTIDGWIAGHVHETVHSFQSGFPIIQNPLGGKYTNVIRLKFQQTSEGQYKVVTNETEIQGPIPICSHVFVSSQKCEQVPSEHHHMIEYKFRDQQVSQYIDQKVIDLFNSDKYKKVVDDVMRLRSNIVFKVDSDFLNVKTDFNPLGALLGQAAKRNFLSKNKSLDPNKVIGIWGYGGFRSEFFAGDVSEADMNTMFPFHGNVVSFQITGDQLLKTIKILQSGRKPFYCFNGVSMDVTVEPYSYIEGSARLDNNEQIQLNDIYTIVTFEFNVQNDGGDDFKTVISNGIIDKNKLTYTVFDLDIKTFQDGFEDKVYHLKDFTDKSSLHVKKINLKSYNEIDNNDFTLTKIKISDLNLTRDTNSFILEFAFILNMLLILIV